MILHLQQAKKFLLLKNQSHCKSGFSAEMFSPRRTKKCEREERQLFHVFCFFLKIASFYVKGARGIAISPLRPLNDSP